MFFFSRFLLLIYLILLTGCLNFANNYSSKTAQSRPVEEIGKWLGARLPNTYVKFTVLMILPTHRRELRSMWQKSIFKC
jgi:hypothetical protein